MFSVLTKTTFLLILSNIFMTFAWYAHFTLVVFIPFAIFYMKSALKWDYVWAGYRLK